jgi:hypothetical protein
MNNLEKEFKDRDTIDYKLISVPSPTQIILKLKSIDKS